MKTTSKNVSNENVDPLEASEWSTEDEVKLFYALRNHKPVGVNRHFEMMFVHEEFCRLMKRDIDVKVIWKHLDTLYDMETLHENEDLPFSNNEMDFDLSNDFDELKKQKIADRTVVDNESSSVASDYNEDSQTYPHRSKSQDTSTVANNTSTTSTTTTTGSNKGKAKSEDRRETRETRETTRDETKTPKPKRNKPEVKTEERPSKSSTAKKRRSQNA